MPGVKGQTNNPNGRPVGSKNERTKQWEVLGEAICGRHAERFNALMDKLWDRADDGDDDALEIAMRSYLQTVEYFMPKLARKTVVGEEGAPPVQIKVDGKTWDKL